VKKGEDILDEAMKVFKAGGKGNAKKLEELSSAFYTAIPHRCSFPFLFVLFLLLKFLLNLFF
jgi:hypothetical protein